MIVTVFRSRLKPGVQDEYGPMAARMSALAKSMPGYISHKGFVAEDGERVTIVEFESEADVAAWSAQADHAAAKRRGREAFYAEYDIKICSVLKTRAFRADR